MGFLVRASLPLVVILAASLAALSGAQPSQSDVAQDDSALRLGESVYMSRCASCHQADGQGVPGAFPPLDENVKELYSLGGRTYLAGVVLFGMSGPIEVNGDVYDGTMPSWSVLSDEEVAAVLNFVLTSLTGVSEIDEGFEPYEADEVASVRERELSSDSVHGMRTGLMESTEGAADESDAAQQVERSVLDGVYTEDQVSRVRDTYQDRCEACHGGTLLGGERGGPPLRGPLFEHRWSGRSLNELYAYTRANMPAGQPQSLGERAYADLIALILEANGLPPGDEVLSPDTAMQSITIEFPSE